MINVQIHKHANHQTHELINEYMIKCVYGYKCMTVYASRAHPCNVDASTDKLVSLNEYVHQCIHLYIYKDKAQMRTQAPLSMHRYIRASVTIWIIFKQTPHVQFVYEWHILLAHTLHTLRHIHSHPRFPSQAHSLDLGNTGIYCIRAHRHRHRRQPATEKKNH